MNVEPVGADSALGYRDIRLDLSRLPNSDVRADSGGVLHFDGGLIRPLDWLFITFGDGANAFAGTGEDNVGIKTTNTQIQFSDIDYVWFEFSNLRENTDIFIANGSGTVNNGTVTGLSRTVIYLGVGDNDVSVDTSVLSQITANVGRDDITFDGSSWATQSVGRVGAYGDRFSVVFETNRVGYREKLLVADNLMVGQDTLNQNFGEMNDSFWVDNIVPGIAVNGGGGLDTLFIQENSFRAQRSPSDRVLIEVVDGRLTIDGGSTFDGFERVIVFGRDGDDVLAGFNTRISSLPVYAVTDAFYGRRGRDTVSYAGADAAVTVTLRPENYYQDTGGGGIDELREIESLTGSRFGDSLSGDGRGNTLDGGDGDDRLVGLGATDYLLGGDGADTLLGGPGNDWLTGGAGTDIMVGGDNRDMFIFTSLVDFGPASARDRIVDFSMAEGDRIDLSAIDPDAGVAGDQAFTYIARRAFSGTAGVYELRYDFAANGDLLFEGDVDSDGIGDFSFLVHTPAILLGHIVV